MDTIENSAQKKVGPHGGRREGSGRKPFQPTQEDRQQVETLAGYGIPHEQIAALVQGGIDRDTLAKYFSEELVAGKAKANAQIGQTLFQKAMSGDTTAMIWWSKAQMRWAETNKQEVTGKDGGPITLAAIDMKGLTDVELEQMQQLLAKAVDK